MIPRGMSGMSVNKATHFLEGKEYVIDAPKVYAANTKYNRIAALVGKSSIIAYYDFLDGSGSTLRDKSGNGNDGTITNAAWVRTPYGMGLSFSAAGHKVIVAAASIAGDWPGPNPTSVLVAAYQRSSGVSGGAGRLLSYNDQYYLYDRGTDYGICIESPTNSRVMRSATETYAIYKTVGATVTNLNAAILYEDGANIKTGNISTFTASGDLAIGNRPAGDRTANSVIFDVLICNRVLTPTEVAAYHAIVLDYVVDGLEFATSFGPSDGAWTPHVIRTATGIQGRWEIDDGGTTVIVTGDNPNYTFTTAGPHTAILYIDPLAVAELHAGSCGLTYLGNLRSYTAMTKLEIEINPSLVFDLSELPSSLTYISGGYSPRIRGDIGDLPAGMLHISFPVDPLVETSLITGNIGHLPPLATWIDFHGNHLINGDIFELPRTCTHAMFGDCNLITGDLKDLPPAIEYANFGQCHLLTGDVKNVPKTCVTLLSVHSNPLHTGKLSDLPNCKEIALELCEWVEIDSIAQATALEYLHLDLCGLTQAQVDAVVDDLHTNEATFTYATPRVKLEGNAAPSSAAITKINTLIGLGWNITYTAP